MKSFSYFLTVLVSSVAIAIAQDNTNSTTPVVAPATTPAASSQETATPTTTTSATNNEPVPYPQQQNNQAPKPEAKPKEPPKKFGECTGDYWIGQRVVSERHAGWGWIRKEEDGWSSAKWVMLQETPRKYPAPGRFYSSPNADNNVQYKLYGYFSTDKGYEPNIDTYVSVFVIKGFEVIGASEPVNRKLPGPTGSQPGRISSRDPSGQRSASDE